jgi:hypothetical protein
MGGANVNATTHTGATVSVTGNITGGNLNAAGLSLSSNVVSVLNVTSNVNAGNVNSTFVGNLTGATVSMTANVTGGNLVTGGLVTATGNIFAGNLNAAGLITATGNVYSGASLTVYNGIIYSTAAGAGISLVPSDATVGVNITGNITPDANNTRTIGNATTYYNNVYANTATIAGNVNLTGVSASGNVTAGNLRTGGVVTATGNIQGGNLVTGGLISATGNIQGGNLVTGGLISATGNVTAGNVNTNTVSGTGTTIKSTGALNLQPTGNVVLTANTYINNLADPVQSQDAASKAYVDSVAQGLDVKASVVYATAAALAAYTYNNGTSGVGATITANATGALSVDGSTPSVSDRILVKNETTTNAPYNGIYTVTVVGNASAAFQLTRSTDFDGTSEMAGAFTFVELGSTNADTGWVCTTNNPITLGTTNITFAQFSGAGTYSAGTGLTLTGTTFSVNASQTQITAIGTQASLSVTGNTTSGNLLTGGLVSATGTITSAANITGGNLLTGGLISSTGNITSGNINTGGLVSAIGNIISTANVSGGNILFGSGVVSGTGNIIGGNLNATGLSLSGNVVGNLNVSGNVQGGNLKTAGLISAFGNIQTLGYFIGDGSQISNASFAGTQLVSGTTSWSISSSGGNIVATIGGVSNVVVVSTGGISTTGNVTAGNMVGTHVGAVQFGSNTVSGTGNVTGGNLLTSALVQGTTLSATGNVIGGNLNAAGLSLSSNVVSALNSTSGITTTANITGGNLIGTVVGNLTGTTVSVTGNITGGNLIGTIVGNVTGTTVSVTGNITGGNLNAAGLSLSSNVVSALNVTSNIAGGNIASAAQLQAANLIISGAISTPSWTTAGVAIKTVPSTYTDSSTAASGTAVTNHINVLGQPTLAGANASQTTTSSATLYVVGAPIAGTNMTITNPYAIYVASGNVVAVANITGGNLLTSGLISSTGAITSSANITGGNLNAAGLSLSSNVVSALNSTSGITTTANITGGNILFGAGVVSGTGNITAGYVNANLTGTSISLSGGVTAASVAGGVMTGTSISLTGAITGTTITGTSLNVSAGVVNLGSITNASANGVGNIGTSTGYFNTLFATATKALYADLAESYASDAAYAPGTVVSFGGDKEVTISTVDADRRVAGVITTEPSYHMNAGLASKHVAVIALQGRVPAKVVGTVRKGDMMVSAGNGAARAEQDPRTGTIIGKALEDFDGESGVIEIAVGRI